MCRNVGIEALVEVHTEDEIAQASEAGALIIGVNNRNLKTFEVDTNNCLKLAKHLPGHVLKVAESGVKSADFAKKVFETGYDAVLMGEVLSRASNPDSIIKKIKELTTCQMKSR